MYIHIKTPINKVRCCKVLRFLLKMSFLNGVLGRFVVFHHVK